MDGLKIDRPRRPVRSRAWIPLAGAALLVLALAGWWLARPSVAEVKVATAREVPVGADRTVLNASGYVTARRQATVSSKVTGKVTEVLIEEGMAVEEGQVLARLDAANARAAVRLAEAELGAAQRAVRETEVRLAEAELELGRAERLVVDAIASQADLDAARAEAESLAARLESQRQAVAVAGRALEVARQGFDDTVIRAPFTGIVVAKNAQPGEMISPVSSGGFTRTGIGTIVDMESLEIEVDVNEAYIERVVPEQPVEARLDAYPDWPLPARVIAIIPTADRQTATVKVRIGFAELDSRILPDMGVKVAFRGAAGTERQPATAVVVPRSAVREEAGQDVVLVVAGGKVERRAVRLAEGGGDEAVVLAGIAAGERVVLEGPGDLADGDRVEEASG